MQGLQRSDDVRPEPRRVIILLIQGKPADWATALAGPFGQQRCLAEAGRRRNERPFSREALVEAIDESLAWDDARPGKRKAKLRFEQDARTGLCLALIG